MRLILSLLLVLQSCAPVAAPASRPVAAAASVPVVLDDTGVRELLAGFELELGDARALEAKQHARADALDKRVIELQQLGKDLQMHATYGPVIAGIVGTIIGGLLGAISVYVALVHK